jgi:WD40 repeat protein
MSANSPGDPDADAHWRLDPALARLAFGADTAIAGGRPSQSLASAMQSALDQGEDPVIDLDDPRQRTFGGFELLELIGRGGMGVVYRAHQHALDRDVAIKLLSAGCQAPMPLGESLRNEAQHAARLQHPNIVAIHEIGEHDGQLFMVMQLVCGQSLSQRIDRYGPMAPREAARLLRMVAEAIDYAHRFGVLHLDLKPGNLLIGEDGTPLVADFGLARRLEQRLEHDHVSGTPGYMAPEQAGRGGAPLSPATDVWALGAILYEMLTGVPPFDADSISATIEQLLHAQVIPPSRHAPVPADLEAICLHCLQKDPVHRYPSARALADDLGGYLEGRAVSVRKLNMALRIARWTRRDPKLATASLLALLVLLTGVGATTLQWRRANDNAQATGKALRAQRAFVLQQEHARGRDPDALPGLVANLVDAERDGDPEAIQRERLRLGLSMSGMPRIIDSFRTDDIASCLALSPDGHQLAVCAQERIEVSMYDTASGRRLWTASLKDEPGFWSRNGSPNELWHLRFSPDGRYLIAGNTWPRAVISPSGMDHWRLDADSGRLARPQSRYPGLSDATYSQDGRFALLRRWDKHLVQLWDAQSWTPVSAPVHYDPVHPAWMIAPGAAFVLRWSPDLSVLEPRSLAVRHRLDNPSGKDVDFTAWEISPDARKVALGDKRGSVYLLDPVSGDLRRLAPGPSAWIHRLRFSNDGRWLMSAAEDGSVWLWSSSDGFSLGRHLSHDLMAWQVDGDPQTGLVWVGSFTTGAVWQAAGLGRDDGDPQPRAPHLRHARDISPFSVDVHPASGLLATGSDDGEIRLWRLPATAVRIAAAAPQVDNMLSHDGLHLLAVDNKMVRVVSVGDDRILSPDFPHPQPIGFAALTVDGGLLTTNGRELRVYDWRHGRLRFPPRDLPATPMRMAVDANGKYVHFSYALDHGEPLNEAVIALALDDGRTTGGPLQVGGDLATLATTTDGSRLVVATGGKVSLHDPANLRPIGRPLRSTAGSVTAVGVGDSPARIIASVVEGNEVYLRTFAPTTGRWVVQAARLREPPSALSLSPDGSTIAMIPACHCAVELIYEGGLRRRVDAPSGTDFARTIAFSRDGHMLAVAMRDGVLLLDPRSGEWLAPPMRAPLHSVDAIVRLAFSARADALLARSAFGRWLWWPLQPDARSADAIARDIERLAPHAEQPLANADRSALRRADPGTTRLAMPAPPRGGCLDPGTSPRADSSARAWQLDLSRHGLLNTRRHDPDSRTSFAVGNLCGLPLGRLRLLGTDFDLHGFLAHDPDALAQHGGRGALARGILVPPRAAHAPLLDLIATSTTQVREPSPDTQPAQADVVLHYADGSDASLPVRYNRDIHMGAFLPPPAQSRVAWRAYLPGYEAIISGPRWIDLYRVRLRNPHPRRVLQRLDIVTRAVTWNGFALFAITAVDDAGGNIVADRIASPKPLPAPMARPPSPGAAAAAPR